MYSTFRLHIRFFALTLIILGASAWAASPASMVRFATLNIAMGLTEPGELALRLEGADDPGFQALAEILQRVRPDVLLLNEVDYDPNVDVANLLQEHYLSHPQAGQRPITYPFSYSGPVNTGVPSGLDIDGNGRLGDPGDAWGFGRFPGQYGMLVLSRFPIETEAVRSFQLFRWKDMPGALQPLKTDGTPFYPPATWEQLRLSSKAHWDLPIRIGEAVVHFLVSHPTPPVFDGPEDHNGRRNYDEIRLWADYISPGQGDYLVDDAGTSGGLPEGASFVIGGDLNADPEDGDSTDGAILQLLQHPRVSASCLPRSEGGAAASESQGGANVFQSGDPAADTGDMNDERTGNLRIDYALPAKGLRVAGCGVFWPAPGQPGGEAAGFSDHRLVWIDLALARPD